MAFKHDAVKKRKDYFEVDPRQIIVAKGWNKRTDFDGEEELKQSIIENGVLVPMRLKRGAEDQLVLIDGERRLRATRKAISEGHDIKTVPCIVERRNLSEVEAMYLHIVTNDGKAFNAIEEAAAFSQLASWGISNDDIARRVGRSESFVRQRLELIDASPDVKKAIVDRQISMNDAKKIIKSSGGSVKNQKKKLASTVKKKNSSATRSNGCNMEKVSDVLNAQIKKIKGLPTEEQVNWAKAIKHTIDEHFLQDLDS